MGPPAEAALRVKAQAADPEPRLETAVQPTRGFLIISWLGLLAWRRPWFPISLTKIPKSENDPQVSQGSRGVC